MKLSKQIMAMAHSPVKKYYVYANRAKMRGKKIYHLNIGQPDIKTPPEFMEAVRSFDEDVLAYSASEGMTETIDAQRRYYRRYHMDYSRSEIIITNGGSEALLFAMACIINPGDEIIIPEPYYTNYNLFTGIYGGKIVPVTTKAEEGYHYADKNKLKKAISPKTKAICLCNPGNPTGTALSKDEMKMICDLAVEHDFFIIADEVYREFCYDTDEILSFGQFEEASQNVIITDSISKRFSACGARIGSMATKNKDVYENAMKLAQARLCCPTLDQIGAVTLYDLPKDFFDKTKEEYNHRRNVAYNALQKIEGIVCEKPRGAFYITCKLPVKDAEDFLIWMLDDFEDRGESTMFVPAEGFYGTPGLGRDEIRLAYVLNEKDLLRGIELIKLGLKEYRR